MKKKKEELAEPLPQLNKDVQEFKGEPEVLPENPEIELTCTEKLEFLTVEREILYDYEFNTILEEDETSDDKIIAELKINGIKPLYEVGKTYYFKLYTKLRD